MPVRLMLASVLLLLALAVRLSAEETSETRVAKFGQDLSSAWSSYPLEKDATVRKQKIADLSTAMNADLSKVDLPDGITLQRALDNFLSNLQKCRTLFKLEKMASERSQYVAVCANVFRREVKSATDLTADRTATKCFEMLVGWADTSRTALRSVPDDNHAPYYSALSETFTLIVKSSTKDAGDPTEIYDKQLKEITRRFPATGAFQKTNGPIASLLETAAKAVNTRNKLAQ